jgi:hypothetical protein
MMRETITRRPERSHVLGIMGRRTNANHHVTSDILMFVPSLVLETDNASLDIIE